MKISVEEHEDIDFYYNLILNNTNNHNCVGKEFIKNLVRNVFNAGRMDMYIETTNKKLEKYEEDLRKFDEQN